MTCTGEATLPSGNGALISNTSGINNTALGFSAGSDATTGGGNVYVGSAVAGVAGESNHTYIRNINITNVSGGGTDTVTVNLATGLLGHATSSRRYKQDIRRIDEASEALYRLKPVSYRYKKEIDSTQSTTFGLIAEEVAEVNPTLVARNSDGQPESVHYDAVNAMLLNEFLKEHKAFVEQQRKLEQQDVSIAKQQKQIEALTTGLQKVSAEIEASKTAPQVVNNP